MRPGPLLGMWLAGAAVLAGCASAAGAAPTQPAGAPPPQTLAAQSLAHNEFGRLSGGDFGGAWDLWTASAQQALSRADYVALNTRCRPALGVPYLISSMRADNQTTVTVFWRHGTTTGSDSVVYQQEHWRFQPSAGALAGYRLGQCR